MKVVPRKDEPSVDHVRACIEACICPYCGAGPFRLLPQHTRHAHGIDKWGLREAAHYSSNDRISSLEHVIAVTERMNERFAGTVPPELARATRAKVIPARTSAGLKAQRANLFGAKA